MTPTSKVRNLLDEEGKLPTYTWPGAYPIFYIDDTCNVICPNCANDTDDDLALIVDYDENLEDPSLYCDRCSQRIPSAYEEDGEERYDD